MYTKTSNVGLKSVPRALPPLPRKHDGGCDCDVVVDGLEITLRLKGCLDMRPLDALTEIITAHADNTAGGYITLDLTGIRVLRDSGLALLINLSQRAAAMGLHVDITGLRQDILERLHLIEDKAAANW